MNKAAIYILTLSLISLSLFMGGCTQARGLLKSGQAPGKTSAAWHKATMKSYTVRGKRYAPVNVSLGETMHGVSSWYGPNFHGKYTSNGEVYNMYSRTAAHKTWPMDTMVRVTNLQNGKSTTVRINDRGPFVSGRIIDCSYTAGKELGLDKSGIAKVSLEVIGSSSRTIKPKKSVVCRVENIKKSTDLVDFGIQIAAFRNLNGAELFKDESAGVYGRYTPTIRAFAADGGEMLYKVFLAGFNTEQEARQYKENNGIAGAVVTIN